MIDGVRIPVAGLGSPYIVIGEPYLNKHLNLCGNPGMGKSTLMMHLLDEIERRGEVAIVGVDPKQEYFQRYYRPERNDWNIDPASADCCYWASEREVLDRAAAEAWGLSFIPDPPGEDNRFFPQNARAALAGILDAHSERKSPTDPCSCENLARWLAAGETELMRRLVSIAGTGAFNPKAPQQLAGLTGTVAPLAPSFGMMPRKSERRREFTVREWNEHRDCSWIFFTSTPETRDASRPVQTAILDNLLRAIEKEVEGRKRIWVLCDELSMLKRMNSLIESAAMQRASGNPLVLGYQASAQIEMLYGRAGKDALLGMAFTQVCFASTDPVIQKHIEEQCGYAEVERISENLPAHLWSGSKHARSSSFTSHQVAHDPLVMATEIGGFPPYDFVIKQRDMVRRERIVPNTRPVQCTYRRRLIPDMPLPLSTEEEPVPLDDEDLVPVDGSEGEDTEGVPDAASAAVAKLLETLATMVAQEKQPAKKGGRPPSKKGATQQQLLLKPGTEEAATGPDESGWVELIPVD